MCARVFFLLLKLSLVTFCHNPVPFDWVPSAPLQEMEELKTSLRSKSDIDFLRKTLRQNYDRFISQGDGRVR